MALNVPPDNVREVIANSLHDALCRVMQPSILHIAPINTIGAFLLRHVTGLDYRPVAGSIEVLCGGNAFGLEAHIENVESHLYYVWIEGKTGERSELVDFGSRYWTQWAAERGIPWLAGPPPPYVWSARSEVPPWIARYHPHPEITAVVRRAIDLAISAPEPEETVIQWETAINGAIDNMLDNEVGAGFLVAAGIAQPINDEAQGSGPAGN